MEESSIFRSTYKLLGLCAHPRPQQSSPYRTGCVLHQAWTILWKSIYGWLLPPLGFCLVAEDSGFWTMLSPVCLSCLENWRDWWITYHCCTCFSPSTAMAWRRSYWSGQCWGCEFYRLMQQLAMWGCVVCFCFVLFFRLNKQVQHKLALCCWFLFSISWGLFAS